jgi:hypothetical protein
LIEDNGCATAVRVIARGNFSKFFDDCRGDDDRVLGQTKPEWIGFFVGHDPETHEGGGI